MPYCKKCGTEYVEGAKYCTKYGAPIEEWRPPREECFGWERGGEIWGIIAAGVFIIGLAILWYFDLFWPGILFLIGIMILIGGIISYVSRGRRVRRPPSSE